jgi:hypothetical protein
VGRSPILSSRLGLVAYASTLRPVSIPRFTWLPYALQTLQPVQSDSNLGQHRFLSPSAGEK